MANSIYQYVPTAKVPKSIFDNSFTHKMTGRMGMLYPICIKQMVPGDVFRISNQMYLKFMPTINPIFHDIFLKTRWFFVPHRLVDDDFEEAITGGEDGESKKGFPIWNPDAVGSKAAKTDVCVHGTLWDYFGFPLLDTETAYSGSLSSTGTFADECMPLAYPLRAVNRCWNDWFRDEETQTKIVENETETGYNYNLLRVNWHKDRFTSSGQEEQRGTAPALPLSGTIPVLSRYTLNGEDIDFPVQFQTRYSHAAGTTNGFVLHPETSTVPPTTALVLNKTEDTTATAITGTSALHPAFINAKDIGSFTIKDIRLTNAIQKWQERNEECGSRYGEYLRSQYGVYPRDERLQRPEYIGGTVTPVMSNPVVQNSESTSGNPLGREVTRMSAVDSAYVGTYKAQEFGTLVGFMYVVPKASYISQGFPAEWMWHDKFDFPNPLFAHLGNVPVRNGELFAKGIKESTSGGVTTPGDDTIFGWQGKDDELRDTLDKATSGFRTSSFNNWTFDRSFTDYPGNNSQFRQVNLDSNNSFVVQGDNYQFACYVGVGLKTVRPIPKFPTPML